MFPGTACFDSVNARISTSVIPVSPLMFSMCCMSHAHMRSSPVFSPSCFGFLESGILLSTTTYVYTDTIASCCFEQYTRRRGNVYYNSGRDLRSRGTHWSMFDDTRRMRVLQCLQDANKTHGRKSIERQDRTSRATGANPRDEKNDKVHHRLWNKPCRVIQPVFGMCALANFPTRVLATAGLCKNMRWVKITMLFLHLESMTFVRLWFFMNPGAYVRTMETMM